jgi:hypothetical protein
MLKLFNPFKAEYDADVALSRASVYIWIILIASVPVYIDYLRSFDDLIPKVLLSIGGIYLCAVINFINDSLGRGLNKISRNEREIERLKSELKQLSDSRNGN